MTYLCYKVSRFKVIVCRHCHLYVISCMGEKGVVKRSYSWQFHNFEQPEASLFYVLMGVNWIYNHILGKVERLTEIK